MPKPDGTTKIVFNPIGVGNLHQLIHALTFGVQTSEADAKYRRRSPMSNQNLPSIANLRTQKARGIVGLADGRFGFVNNGFAERPSVAAVVQSDAPLLYKIQFPTFARPCPVTPRHGFVESREVADPTQVKAVWEEAKKEDPDAEMILMEKLPGDISAVATNAGVTFGFGHDGVTGQGPTKFIPGKVPSLAWNRSLGCSSDWSMFNIHDTAYVELVENVTYAGHAMVAVQVRDGPSQDVSRNFIPRTTMVTRILEIGKKLDLLTWERRINKAVADNGKKPDGLVFYFPKGNLSSHYSIHAIQLGVAVITEPMINLRIGMRLAATAKERPVLTTKDYKFLAEEITRLSAPSHFCLTRQHQAHIKTAMATVHAMSTWEKEPHLLTMQAAAAVVLSRFILAITCGEARHFYGDPGPYRNNYYYKQMGAIDWKPLVGMEKPSGGTHRGQVVDRVLEIPFSRLIPLQEAVALDHLHKGWRSGYGGRKWGRVSRANLKLLKTIEAFVKTPSKARWGRILLLLNRTVNMVHNGNQKLLEKYVMHHVMDILSKSPTLGFINSVAGHLVLNDMAFFSNPEWSDPYDTEKQEARKPTWNQFDDDETADDDAGSDDNSDDSETLDDSIPF